MVQRSHHLFIVGASCLLVMALFLVAVPQATAQDGVAEPEQTTTQDPNAGPESNLTVGVQGGRYGVGFASSWPAYGVSGTLQISEKLTAEAVLGFFGTVSNFGGKAWYRFKQDPEYDLYGYASAGVYRWGNRLYNENVLGLGGGVGVEVGLGNLLDEEDFPPVFINAEVGLAMANFQHYNFSSFVFGSGIHYRFGSH